jgi:hypothetical protein
LLWILRTLLYAAYLNYRFRAGSALRELGQRRAETSGEGAAESCVRNGFSSIGNSFPQKSAPAGSS